MTIALAIHCLLLFPESKTFEFLLIPVEYNRRLSLILPAWQIEADMIKPIVPYKVYHKSNNGNKTLTLTSKTHVGIPQIPTEQSATGGQVSE